MIPVFNNIDVIAFYLPKTGTMLLYHRFFLEIMFTFPDTWKLVKGIFKKEHNIFNVFFDSTDFTQAYFETVKYVCIGKRKEG